MTAMLGIFPAAFIVVPMPREARAPRGPSG